MLQMVKKVSRQHLPLQETSAKKKDIAKLHLNPIVDEKSPQ